MNDNADNTTVKDDSRQGKDGTFNDAGGNPNTSAHSTAGKIKTALTFDGSDDYITVPDNVIWDVGDELSIVLWFKTSVQDQGRPCLVIHDLSAYKYEVLGGSDPSPSMGEINFRLQTSGGIVNPVVLKSDDYYADGNWHQLIATYERSLGSKRAKVYIDGKLEATDDGYDAAISSGDEGIIIGDGTFNKFQGDIDAVMIFNRALSEAEIGWLWNGGNGREHLTGSRPLVDGSLASGVRRLAG
jgi:hypothetical protein